MKGYHSNSKVVFAYQDNESNAAAINTQLSTTATGSSVIRVVQETNTPGLCVKTHPNYSSLSSATGLEEQSQDSLVGVTVSRIIRINNSGNTQAINVNSVRSITSTYLKGYRIFDIQLTSTFNNTLDVSSSDNGQALYKAVIELFFSSGDTEDLILNLRGPGYLFLNISPFDLTMSDPYGFNLSTISSTNLDNTFLSYSISKAYRSLNERENASNNTSFTARNLYSIGSYGYTPFSLPFGVLYDQYSLQTASLIQPTGPGPSYAPGGFASSQTSHMTWFSGREDLTRMRIPNYDGGIDTNRYVNSETSIEQGSTVDLFNFFHFEQVVNNYSQLGIGELIGGSSIRERTYQQGTSGWGQLFGWFSTFQNGNLVDSQDNIIVSQNAQNFGVPPIFKEDSQTPNTGINSPSLFWGEFSESAGSQDGNYIGSFGQLTPDGSGILSSDPVSVRVSKLFYGPGNFVPGTSVPTDAIHNLDIDLNDANAFPRLYNLASVRNSFCFWPRERTISFNSSARFGSIIDAGANSGANFFYSGCAGTAQEPFMPVFKGIIRASRILRYTTEDNLGQCAFVIAKDALIAHPSDYSVTDPKTFLHASVGMFNAQTGTIGLNRFNGIDLYSNLLYTGHNYPARVTGSLSQTQSQHLPNIENSVGQMYLWRKGWESLKGQSSGIEGSEIGWEAQDIVFLNSAFVPDGYNTSNPTIRQQDINDADSLLWSRNHPIGHPLSAYNGNASIPNSMDVYSQTNTSGISKPYIFTSLPFLSIMGESATEQMPPYPYAPTYFITDGSQQENYKNYASETSVNGYFDENVSDSGDGQTFATGKGVRIPTYIGGSGAGFITGTNNCLTAVSSSVQIIGGNDDDLGSAVIDSSVKLVYRFRYVNSCTAPEFTTPAGDKVTNGATVADRITEVLAIFPHIEYRPLAMLSALGENPLAYKTIVQDDDDVDDIYIESQGGTLYDLVVVIKSDPTDVIIDGGVDTPVPYADVWGDLPWPTQPSTEANSTSVLPFSERYLSVHGESEFGRHKSSYITIASSASWNTFLQEEGSVQSTSGDATQFAYHTPFIAYNNAIDEDDVNPIIFGCTDSTADNYDPAATDDDGSCTDCVTNTTVGNWDLATSGLNDGSVGIRVGVVNPANNIGGYLFGLMSGAVGGVTVPMETYFNPPPGSIYDTPGARYGGAFISDSNYFGQAADGYLTIRAGSIGVGAISTVLEYLQNQYSEDHTAWRLKIKPLSDVLINSGLNLNSSYSNANPVPAQLTAVTPVYNALATEGGIFTPQWTDILIPNNPINGLNAGVPYILELSLEPQNTGPECEVLNSTNNVVLGLMWVTFCACGVPGNDYFYTAMNGALYDWQANLETAFPVITYNSQVCPDAPPIDDLFGDSPYPQNICFQADAQLNDCSQYWLYCLQSSQLDCASELFSLDEAYQVGENGAYYFDYVNGFILTNVEGVYNPTVDGFVWDPNIEYIVTVSNGTSYFASQDQTDSIAGEGANIFQNQFEGIVEPGVYTVTFTFFAPYDSNFNDPNFPDNNCSFQEEVVIGPPNENCPEIITGCTDEGADNYDPNANYDDGSCSSEDPCTDILLNPSLEVTLTTTPSTSLCVTDDIVVNGTTYSSTVIVPDNNGSITATINYTAANSGIGVNNFALLILPNPPTGGVNVNTVVDSVGLMFASGQVPTVDDLPGGITGIGYWSNIFTVSGPTAQFEYTQTGLSPGNYYVIAVVNPSVEGLEDCGEGSFVALLEQILETNVGLTDPDEPCPEPCIGTDCPDYILDCTDPAADNYNPDATFDDGSCEYTETFCEQNPTDELCIDCSDIAAVGGLPPVITSRTVEETICDPVTGSDGFCTDPNACNYNPDAALDESNNLICDYCGCIEDPNDPDCYQDDDCDPALDPNCGEPEPECPDPGNPACDPTIFDPCPVGECGPPDDPCIILGNCEGDPNDDDDDGEVFEDVISTVEVTCPPDIETADGSDLNFDSVLLQAFQCMSQEGQKMLFRMKSAAYYDDTDILKLSLIAYLFNGGLNKVQLPCLFNCNYETNAESKVYDCVSQWAATGGRYYNSVDTYQKGDIVIYYYMKGNKVTRNYYIATREIQPIDLHPRYAASGWHRCSSVTVRKADKNNIATGEEEYLQIMWEFMVRFCTECKVVPTETTEGDVNNVDPTVLKNYLDPKTTNNNLPNSSGILGEDGEEIIF